MTQHLYADTVVIGGGTAGAATGLLVAGPVGAIIGGAAGTLIGHGKW